jgi:hypothetical protein
MDSILRRTAAVPPEYDKTSYGSGYLNVLVALQAAGQGQGAGSPGNGRGRGA